MSNNVAGIVIYTDGGAREGSAGWGLHAYTYSDEPLKRGIGIPQLPTKLGYVKTELENTVTPQMYYDWAGNVKGRATNNSAELIGMLKAFDLVLELGVDNIMIFTDSKYVKVGIKTHMKKWSANGWKKASGETIENLELWKRIHKTLERWNNSKITYDIDWIKAHAGHIGNELADFNATLGIYTDRNEIRTESEIESYHNPKSDPNPLLLKSRGLFNVGEEVSDEDRHYYFTYSLARHSNYGHKQDDTKWARIEKTDLLLGRRISDAVFCVAYLNERDEHLDKLMDIHTARHKTDIVDIAVLRLDTAMRPKFKMMFDRFGEELVNDLYRNQALIDPTNALISKTLYPPRLAQSAVNHFDNMRQTLKFAMTGEVPPKISIVEITDQIFDIKEVKGKAKCTLRKDITNATTHLDVIVPFKGQDVKLRVLLGVDLPDRNALSRLADVETKVWVYVTPTGPMAYTFNTIVRSHIGWAIFDSPYTQFMLKKTSETNE